MAPTSPEIDAALTMMYDRPVSEEFWLGPGVSLLQGEKYLYVNPRQVGRVAVVPVNWYSLGQCQQEIARRSRLHPDVAAAHQREIEAEQQRKHQW